MGFTGRALIIVIVVMVVLTGCIAGPAPVPVTFCPPETIYVFRVGPGGGGEIVRMEKGWLDDPNNYKTEAEYLEYMKRLFEEFTKQKGPGV